MTHQLEIFRVGGESRSGGGLGSGRGCEVRNRLAGDGVLLAEGGEALDEVAEIVGELVVIGVLKLLPGEIGVGKGVNVAKEEVAEGVQTVAVQDLYRINDVAEALAHLLTAGEDVTVRNQAPRQGQAEAEQDGGPGDGVEAENVFADKLSGGGPKIGDGLVGIAENGEVVGEGVHPDIHHLGVVTGNGNTPSELLAGAGNGDVRGIF